jgi:hydrogenase expression/formation protein HypE
MPHGGKARKDFMERVVYDSLGMESKKVLVGPGQGLDNAVVSAGSGRVMILTVDPMSAIPAIGMRLSAWLSVHLIASDFTTSGADPEFASFSYNFPGRMTEQQKEEYVRSVGKECRRLGIAISAGHTGSYPGGGFTVIGSGSMFGFASRGGFVTPAMAGEGDTVLMTKSAAIEATMTLALSFPRHLGRKLGTGVAHRAGSLLKLCTTVEDARAARREGVGKGGVTSMHDATEGGVLGALGEMAQASGRAFMVDPLKIPVSKEADSVCREFGLDPLRTMGEGALLITCAPGRVEGLRRRMSREGIQLAQIGAVAKGSGLWLFLGGRLRKAKPSGQDRFWAAYDSAVRDRLT